MAGLKLGDLRNRIDIQQKTRGASDGAGGNTTETWATFKKVWARVEPMSAREIAVADQIVHRVLTKITIRRRTDITTAMRITYQGRTFGILGLREMDDAGWRWTEITAEDGTPS